jgi:hypothetical protein
MREQLPPYRRTDPIRTDQQVALIGPTLRELRSYASGTGDLISDQRPTEVDDILQTGQMALLGRLIGLEPEHQQSQR